jgi:argonaute-like protein implicated in RNA metabolism and viral defense
MKIEELLQPRFKVIANFPDSTRNIGDIIYVDNKKEKYWSENYEKWLSTFPHLFKKLEWFEDRKIEDLPEYLKDEFGVDKVLEYKLNINQVVCSNKDSLFFTEFIGNYQPSTKEEYEANNNV